MRLVVSQLRRAPRGSRGRIGGRRCCASKSAAPPQAKAKQLVFDLPRSLTRGEKIEVREELAEALLSLPAPLQTPVVDPEEVQIRMKVDLISAQLDEAGVEHVLKLIKEVLNTAAALSTELRRELVMSTGLGRVLRQVFDQRHQLSPEALCAGVAVTLKMSGPGTEQPAALAEALLDELRQMLPCVPVADAGSLLTLCAQRTPPLSGATHFLEALLGRLAEQAPADVHEEELVIVFSALGDLAGSDVDPGVLEDLLEALSDVWPLCSASTLLTVLLRLGQVGVLDIATFRAFIVQFEARFEILGAADRETLLFLLTLHKSAYDRSHIRPHPLYDDKTKQLIRALADDASERIAQAPLESLVRPVLAMAELGVLRRPAQDQLTERLASGRLLSLPASAFVSLVYAHRLACGPVLQERLRQPLCIAFGALLHAMGPRQIASCIENLWRYAGKKTQHVFTTAYVLLARSLEAHDGIAGDSVESLTPAEVSSAILTYARIRFEDSEPLVRILRAVAPDVQRFEDMQSPQQVGGMLQWMSMGQLVDVLEAWGEQGLGQCGAAAAAVLRRHQENGGRISRRNTVRALHALALIGEKPQGLTDILLSEVDGWIEQDPSAAELTQRPALSTLWSLCALDLTPRAAPAVDWLLGFLCRREELASILEVKQKACCLFESLCVVRHELPDVTMKYLGTLQAAQSSLASQASQALSEIGGELPSPEAMLTVGDSITESSSRAAEGALPRGPTQLLAEQSSDLSADPMLHDLVERPDAAMPGQSVLDELGMRWQLDQRAGQDAVSKAKVVLGEVFAATNLGKVLRKTPHPGGTLAAEATRLTGGFELRWEVGPYNVDWGHPYLRLGILVLNSKKFVRDRLREEHALLATSRLRLRHLRRVEGWHVLVLRSRVVEEALVPPFMDGPLLNPQLAECVRRANAVHPLEAKVWLRKLRRASNDEREVVRGKLFRHLAAQLEIIFPGSLVPLEPELKGFLP